eukprot:481578-Rhodomonas_salina.1
MACFGQVAAIDTPPTLQLAVDLPCDLDERVVRSAVQYYRFIQYHAMCGTVIAYDATRCPVLMRDMLLRGGGRVCGEPQRGDRKGLLWSLWLAG